MRICVFALALVALAQPAFAKERSHSHSHRHAHHAAYHHARVHHYAQMRMRPMLETGAVQMFARTDAIDRPFFSDPSFPNRSRSQTGWNQSGWTQGGGWNEAAAPATAQPFGFGVAAPRVRAARVRNTALDASIARHAAANGLPVELVHRVVKRESGYNPRASHAGNIGLMQIRYATARGIGYSGSPSGLLDPETNLTYAVRYLAGAYRAAGGNASRAVAYYASGYHGRGVRAVAVARRAPLPADAWGWQSAPVLMRTDSARVL